MEGKYFCPSLILPMNNIQNNISIPKILFVGEIRLGTGSSAKMKILYFFIELSDLVFLCFFALYFLCSLCFPLKFFAHRS
jgi:hypothetical protein